MVSFQPTAEAAMTLPRTPHLPDPGLPTPDDAALEHSTVLVVRLREEIAAAGGWLPFARWMDLALHAPGLGYYAGGAEKFGAGGDFVTAPEISPLFARCLARQAAEVLKATGGDLLELGAGTGRLMRDLLPELEGLGALPQRYRVLEPSGSLRARQQQAAAELPPALQARLEWLDRLPESFTGLVLGNEVLDALPVHLVAWRADGIHERGVAWRDGLFCWEDRPLAEGPLLDAARRLDPGPGYLSEIGLAARALVATLSTTLAHGALLFIDYGFPQREYYHPQRRGGTLMCHYRHRSHDDPFMLPGLQDITAHVDFSAVAEAAERAGLGVLGYTSQAAFLVNCGVTELLSRTDPADARAYLPQAAAAQKLLSPAEMGELFKVIALGRGLEVPLLGFRAGDRRRSL